MKKFVYGVLALCLSVVSGYAAISDSIHDVGTLNSTDVSVTTSLNVSAGDVVVMVATGNKKKSARPIAFSSAAGTFAELDASTVLGSDPYPCAFLAYVTVGADGTYDFTATNVSGGNVSTTVWLYKLSADSGVIELADNAAAEWANVGAGATESQTVALDWTGSINVVDAVAVHSVNGRKTSVNIGAAPVSSLTQLIAIFNLPAGTTTYDAVWYYTGLDTVDISKNSGSAACAVFVEIDDTPVLSVAPVFNADPIIKPSVVAESSLSASLAGDAFDANNDPITFSRDAAGPAWLSVAADGTLSGTPSEADLGLNSWTVYAADGISGTASATLQIEVEPIPVLPELELNLVDSSGADVSGAGLVESHWVSVEVLSSDANLSATYKQLTQEVEPTAAEWGAAVANDLNGSVKIGRAQANQWLQVSASTSGGLSEEATVGLKAGPPNVLFILADDLGIEGLNCYRTDGKDWLETPRIDQLATDGMKFLHGVASHPTCQPSRMAILSGQYGPRTGGYRVSDKHTDFTNKNRLVIPAKGDLALSKITIAEQFKAAGYATAMYGKWHVSSDSDPKNQGFDVAYASTKHFNAGDPTRGAYPTTDGFKCTPNVNLPNGMSSAQLFTGMATNFIQAQVEGNQPFFLYMPYYLVHSPCESLRHLEDYFINKMQAGPYLDSGTDDHGRLRTPLIAAMTKLLDDCVGDLLDQLDAMNIAENTIVIFTSDNGCYNVDYTGPHRGRKGNTWEGGMRVPYIFKWPGHIPTNSVSAERITHVDLYPTLLGLVDAELPDPQQHPLDGMDLTDLLTGTTNALPLRQIYCFYPKYVKFDAASGRWNEHWRNVIYEGDFKLIEYPEYEEFELFNLADDAAETRNLLGEETDTWHSLLNKLHLWMDEIGAPGRDLNPDYNGPALLDDFPADYTERFDNDADGEGDNADTDDDNDGMSDLDEEVAGTGPFDPASLLEITQFNAGGSQMSLEWSTVSGKTYSVEASVDLNGPWAPLPGYSNITVSGSSSSAQDSDALSSNRFYRIQVFPSN